MKEGLKKYSGICLYIAQSSKALKSAMAQPHQEQKEFNLTTSK